MNVFLRRAAAMLVSITGIVLIIASGGSGDGASTWSKSFGGELDDWVAGAVPTADGGYLFVGNRDDSPEADAHLPGTSGYGRIWVSKLDGMGELEWEKGYADPSLAAASSEVTRTFSKVVAAADGGAWLIGKDNSPAGDAIAVARLDAAGQVSWTRSYDSSADMPLPYFYPGGGATEGNTIAAEGADGALWIAAYGSAFVRDTRGGGADPTLGVDMVTVYLLKIAPDGSVYASRHADLQPTGYGVSPTTIRPLEDGGVAITGPAERRHDYFLVADAAGQLRSKTWLVEIATIGNGSTDQLELHDFTPMRRTAIAGAAGDDGWVFAGDRTDESFLARYFANERDADDPTEGSADREIRPLENSWRIEISEMVRIWAVAPLCGASTPPNRRCSVLVAGASRASPDELLLATVDTEANISGFMRAVPGITWVCDIRQEPALTSQGRIAYRLLARDFAGGSGTLVIDDQRQVIQPFRSDASETCNPDRQSRLAPGGEAEAVAYQGPTQSAPLIVDRYTTAGQRRWSATLPAAAHTWSRALAVRRLEDGYVIAGDSGEKGQTNTTTILLKIGIDGSLRWQRRVPGIRIASGAFRNFSGGLAAQATGSLLVGVDSDTIAHAMHFDSSGNLSWQRPLWKSIGDSRGTVVALRDGGWLIAGSEPEQLALPLMRMDASGQPLWRRTLAGLGDVDSLVELPAGDFYVGGHAGSVSVVIKMDAAGVVAWSNRVVPEGLGNDAVRVAALPDGGLMLATSSFAGKLAAAVSEEDMPAQFNTGDLVLAKFDSLGARLWERRYGGAYRDVLTSLEATADGGAVLGAASFSLGSRSDRSEGWVLRVGPGGEVTPGCAAELVQANYQPMRFTDGGVTSAVAGAATFAPPGQPAARSAADGPLANATLSTRSVEARQCRGSVAGSSEARPPQARLRVLQGNPGYQGVVSSVPAGILCGTAGGGACEFSFDQGLRVNLQVDPGSRTHFESWTGCDSVSTDGMRCEVDMNADRTVTATFASEPRPPVVNLVVSQVSGRGAVTGTNGMSCRATNSGVCTVALNRGSSAQLLATPDAGRSFLGWEGACANFGNTRAITFFMSEGRSCSARFSGPPPGAPEVTVSYRTPRAGNVTSDPSGINCGAADNLCTEGFAIGSTVTLAAAATQPGFEFESFFCDGYGRSYGSSIELADLRQNTECYADFSDEIERLHLRIVRDLHDDTTDSHVYVDGGGLDCEYDCDRPFLRGDVLLLRAEPFPDYVLTGWSGCAAVRVDSTHPGGNYSCQVFMDQRRDVIAFFTRVRPGQDALRSLAVAFPPGSAPGRITSIPGSIDCTPAGGVCSGSFDIAEQVTLNLESVAGGAIATHEGCDTFTPAGGSDPARCRVSMVNDRSVTFGFSRPDNPPVAAFSFEPATPLAGQVVTFNAAASSDDDAVAGYAWSFTGGGATDATGSVVSHAYGTAGTYTVRLTVTDSNGATDDEVHTVVVSDPAPALPVITQQPQNVSVNAGATASFAVSATGAGPLTYQWLRNGDPVSGATSANYTTLPVSNADNGAVFRVIVRNAAGDTTSDPAVLTVGHGWRAVGGPVATGGAFNPSMAVNAAGTRFVSYRAALGSVHALFVKQFNGTSWTTLGGTAVDPASSQGARDNVLITGSNGDPIVAWLEGTRVRVARWTGTAWDIIGNDLTIDTTDAIPISGLQMERHGNDLVVAWLEFVGVPAQPQLTVKRYNAASGTWSGEYVWNVSVASEFRLALDSAGLAAVAYYPLTPLGAPEAIHVIREGASGWTSLGASVGPVAATNPAGPSAHYGADIRFLADDSAVVVGSADGHSIFSYRYTDSGWVPLDSTSPVFVDMLANDTVMFMSLVRNRAGITLAYTHQQQSGGGFRILTEFVNWNGQAWMPLGDPIALSVYATSPQLDGSGNPMFAAEVRPPASISEIVVQQYVP